MKNPPDYFLFSRITCSRCSILIHCRWNYLLYTFLFSSIMLLIYFLSLQGVCVLQHLLGIEVTFFISSNSKWSILQPLFSWRITLSHSLTKSNQFPYETKKYIFFINQTTGVFLFLKKSNFNFSKIFNRKWKSLHLSL